MPYRREDGREEESRWGMVFVEAPFRAAGFPFLNWKVGDLVQLGRRRFLPARARPSNKPRPS
jgi:hypothetical protein